jgi:hypothetical protein
VALFNELRAALGPEIAAVTMQETLRAMADTGITFDIAVVNEEAIRWAREHAADAIRQMEQTTRRLVEQATATFYETPGMTLGDLQGLLEPAMSPVRAEMIAVTEVTRASSEATNIQQAQLAGAGIEMRRIWQTSHDALVCDICGPLNGLPEEDWKAAFPPGPPAHPRCRCAISLSARDVAEHRERAKELAKEREEILRRAGKR